MKKLNNKGFTLIELLAVIVILAIIMVVTIPTVLNSMGNARQNTFNTSANTVADWVEKEYSLAQIQNADNAFVDVCGTNGSECAKNSATEILNLSDTTKKANGQKLLKAAGVKDTNYSSVTIKITDGRACVTLTASTSGDFAQVANKTAPSTGC